MHDQHSGTATLLPETTSVRRALDELAAGRPIVVHGCDAGDGGLVAAAAHVTTSLMAYLIRHTSGFVGVALRAARCDALNLPPMPQRGHTERGAVPCVTIDAESGIGTGISAADRSLAARLVADPAAGPSDFTRPGHLVPFAVGDSGVLRWDGLAEAANELAGLSGQLPAGVFGHLVSPVDETRMATDDELRRFAAANELAAVDLTDIVAYRRSRL